MGRCMLYDIGILLKKDISRTLHENCKQFAIHLNMDMKISPAAPRIVGLKHVPQGMTAVEIRNVTFPQKTIPTPIHVTDRYNDT